MLHGHILMYIQVVVNECGYNYVFFNSFKAAKNHHIQIDHISYRKKSVNRWNNAMVDFDIHLDTPSPPYTKVDEYKWY